MKSLSHVLCSQCLRFIVTTRRASALLSPGQWEAVQGLASLGAGRAELLPPAALDLGPVFAVRDIPGWRSRDLLVCLPLERKENPWVSGDQRGPQLPPVF